MFLLLNIPMLFGIADAACWFFTGHQLSWVEWNELRFILALLCTMTSLLFTL